MSRYRYDKKLDRLYLAQEIGDEDYGHFSILYCDKHMDAFCFTDQSGSDNCLVCVEEMFEKGTDMEATDE